MQLDWGILVGDYLDRNELELLRNGIGCFPGASKAVILTGMGPDLTYKNQFLVKASYTDISSQLDQNGIWGMDHITKIANKNVFLIYALSKDNCAFLQKDGWKIYIFSEHAPAIVYNAYKFDPFNIGIEKLEVLNPNAFYK